MPRSASKFLGPLGGLLVLFYAYASILGIQLDWSDYEGGPSLAESLIAAAEFVLVGRILLAWLPPGRQGGHAPRDLPLTLAVSYLLGTIALGAWEAVANASFARGLDPADARLLWSALRYGPWIALGGLRLATLPAALVPRHEVRRRPPGPLVRALVVLAILWAGLLVAAAPWLLNKELPWFALWIVVAHALTNARRAAGGVVAVALLGLLSVSRGAAHPGTFLLGVHPATFGIGLGAAFLVGWLRQADRRAAWLAAIGFASCATSGVPVLALAGLATLILSSRNAQRRTAWTASLVAGALVGLPGFLMPQAQGSATRPDPLELLRIAFDLQHSGPFWLLFASTLVAGTVLRIREGEVTREKLALVLLFVFAILALLPLPWTSGERTILEFAHPAAVLLIGLIWIPEEQTTSATEATPGRAT